MSIQISPWSTHQKPFKLDIKKKLARLSPISGKQRKKRGQSQLPTPFVQEKYSDTKNYLEATIQHEEKFEEVEKEEEKQPEEHLPPEFRRKKQRIQQVLEQIVLLKIIYDRTTLQQSLPFLLPPIKPQKKESLDLNLGNMRFENNTIDLGKPIKMKKKVKKKKNPQESEGKSSRVKVMNYNPFDDREIIERGLALLSSPNHKVRKNIGNLSVRIKGL